MIYTKLLITATLAALLLAGCESKQPEPQYAETGLNNVTDVEEISGETVTIDENSYNNANSNNTNNGTKSQGYNSKNGANGKYNSSADGLQSIYFGFGAYGINEQMQDNLAKNVEVLRNSSSRVKIEGNCDEFGTDEYNYALGLKRAKAVKDSISALGVPTDKMVIISFGESSPVCQEPTDECYARNRRVDLRLVK